MVIRSFVRDSQRLLPIEVELTLWPGLPCIQYLGLPDQQIKESALRIKSAIKSQGFDFPKSQQILVNLRPNHIKKTSQGIELAVVLAYLLETEQIPKCSDDFTKNCYVYGSLSLSGEVQAPRDMHLLSELNAKSQILSGPTQTFKMSSPICEIQNLQDLKNKLHFKKKEVVQTCRRPQFDSSLKWSNNEAQFMAVVAAGGHHALLAGPSGSGKSTMAKAIHKLLPYPEVPLQSDWRPLVQPHHSVTQRAMIGGGSDIGIGEITRACDGILLLDEFLEFSPEVLESLREPIEDGVIRLARGAEFKELKANAQLIATTNLCPCGLWVPSKQLSNKSLGCRFSKRKCYSYSERLSGPIMDRFQILYYADGKSKQRDISTAEILSWVQAADAARKARAQKKGNNTLSLQELEDINKTPLEKNLLPEQMGSERRRLATLRVARTFADMQGKDSICSQDLQKTLSWTYKNFNMMVRWD